MTDYILYGESCGITRADMARVIQTKYPHFTKVQMSMASNPERNALQLIPAAEEMLVAEFGIGPGLSISPRVCNKRNHENKMKPHKLGVRVNDQLREQMQIVYEQMGFATMQDFIEAAIAEFVQRHERRAA